uniref:Putative lens epithelium-derived growth factor n=1 Tax=Anopheles braziliensis TaxID=58242 RepID=A0A2M3Z607_9DIPT
MAPPKISFAVGDLVFARVRGYPAWPAKIMRIEKTKYNVYFYGTGETANIKSDNLYPYGEETKEKFVSEKIMKRKGFKEAMIEIASAMAGQDCCPLSYDVAIVRSSLDSHANEVKEDKPIAPAKKKKTVPLSSAGGNEGALLKVVKKEPPELEVFDAQPNPDDDKEFTTRSGRKIKIKRFANRDDEDSAQNVTPPKEKAPTVRINQEKTKTVTRKSKPAGPFDNLSSECIVLLSRERKLVECIIEMKSTVSFTDPKAERCIELLNLLQDMQLTSTMLKKNPNCVEVIKRLRGYVGNADEWDMDEKQRVKFDFLAKQIREKAEEIYDRFPAMFPDVNKEVPFWPAFQEVVAKFVLATQHLSPVERYLLVDEAEIGRAGYNPNHLT